MSSSFKNLLYPKSLYDIALSAVVKRPSLTRKFGRIPDNIYFDYCHKLFSSGFLCTLCHEFRNFWSFIPLLTIREKRNELHQMFQALMDHGIGLARSMSETFSMYCLEVKDDAAEAEAVDKAFQVGLSLSQFLSEAGWFQEAETILFSSKSLLSNSDDDRSVLCSLHCLLRLLRVQNSFALISPAKKSLSESQKLLEIVQERKIDTNLAALYKEIAELYFILSRYDEAYSWSCRSLRELTPSMPPHVVIDAYRQTAKCCMMRRDFSQADLVIEEAVSLALHHYGEKSLKYAGTLVDYGFFLLSMDRVKRSVEIYTKALHIYKEILGGNNLLVALRYEELAYACYVNQYSLGKFFSARTHVEHALSIFRKLLPPDHLYFSSALRVKALVLEELSLDSQSKTEGILEEAESLHLRALELVERAYGEDNLQTAKHYGNLGRLYQSMKRYKDAESMHLKAIRLKEKFLGPDDYDVALSLGHLASVYNYDMNLFEAAEALYLRSIEIGIRHFGESYSGLEYDYRGLLRVYSELKDYEKTSRYSLKLGQWRFLRDTMNVDEEANEEWSGGRRQGGLVQQARRPRPVTEFLELFFLSAPSTVGSTAEQESSR